MLAAASPLPFYLSSPPSSPAIRITHAGRSYVGYLAHDELANQDTLGWLYEQPSDDVAQLALDCLLARGERTIPGAVYQGNETELEMDAACEAELAEREPTDDEMQADRERIYDCNARTEAARGAA